MLNIALSDIRSYKKELYLITVPGKGNKEWKVAAPKELISRIERVFRGKVFLFESRNGGRVSDRDPRFRRQYVSTQIHRLGIAVLATGPFA
jgi:hypothetical protein